MTTKILPHLRLSAIVLALAACSNPVEHEDHPQGLVVVDAQGTEVASYTVAGGPQGQITVGVNTATTFTVHATAEDGDHIAIDGDELSLGIVNPPAGWGFAIDSNNRLVVTAPAGGSTTLTMQLEHGGHPEFSATFAVVAQ
jgi:hypothetical protein